MPEIGDENDEEKQPRREEEDPKKLNNPFDSSISGGAFASSAFGNEMSIFNFNANRASSEFQGGQLNRVSSPRQEHERSQVQNQSQQNIRAPPNQQQPFGGQTQFDQFQIVDQSYHEDEIQKPSGNFVGIENFDKQSVPAMEKSGFNFDDFDDAVPDFNVLNSAKFPVT